MSQKLPFNNVPPIFLVPESAPRIFHKLTENPPAIWELYLWIATNSVAPVNVALLGTGSFGTAALANQLVPAGAVGQIIQIADGLPVRGPMDLRIDADDSDVKLPMVAFGYVSRGGASTKPEKRFFDPGGNIADQVTAFQGGVSQAVLGFASADIHQTSKTFLDEITLDVRSPDASATVGVFFDTSGGGVASEGLIGLVFPGGAPIRIFDGVPFRDAGLLKAESTIALPATNKFFTGHFVRG
jgi:hypothetical protein